MTTVKEDREELTLLSLPDVPLLNVLSHLPTEDLVAAGMASPRLGALAGTCAALWRQRWRWLWSKSAKADRPENEIQGFWTLQGVDDILALVRVVPMISTFEFSLYEGSDPWCMLLGNHVSKSTAWIGIHASPELAFDAIRELGPRLQVLRVCRANALDGLFAVLQNTDCNNLQTLDLDIMDPTTSGPWPQEVRLPRLNNLKLSVSLSTISASTVEDLRSLMRAHSGQLQSLSLDKNLISLLCDCPVGLRCLEVPSCRGLGLAAALAQTQGLKELRLTVCSFRYDPMLTDVVEFLDSHRRGSQLERLVLLEPWPETLLALEPDRLSELQHLELSSTTQYEQWKSQPGALGALHNLRLNRLRSLTLRGILLNLCNVFAEISAAEIPALELLLLSSNHTTFEDFEKSAQMFRDLVSRAPRELHALLLAVRDGCELKICRHPSPVVCGLCTEAVSILHEDYCGPLPIQVRHVQV